RRAPASGSGVGLRRWAPVAGSGSSRPGSGVRLRFRSWLRRLPVRATTAPWICLGARGPPASRDLPFSFASLSCRLTPLRANGAVAAPRRSVMADSTVPKRAAGLAGFDAYNLALELYRRVLAVTRGGVQAERIDQLTRAAEAVIRNIGEGHPTVRP